MTAIRTGTTVEWGQVPLWYGGAEMDNQQTSYSGNYILSANMPMIYQVMWSGTSVNEMYVPAVSGDVINVIFKVFTTTEYPVPAASADWDLIGTIKKSMDIPNTNVVNSNVPNSQRYTIDISRMVSDQLSYSLVPIDKGSWQNQEYGGMNGGPIKQDNITETISPYNVSRNGAYRAVKVRAEIEMLNSDLELELSTTTVSSASTVRVINSVPPFGIKPYYNQMYNLQQWGVASSSQKRAMTQCPNQTVYTTDTPNYKKPVSIKDEAEFLYFYCSKSYNGNDDTDYYNLYEVYGQAYDKDGTTGLSFVLGSEWENQIGTTAICSDISHNFEKYGSNAFEQNQNQLCVQNVAPAYINSHAYAPQSSNYPYVTARTPITSNTGWYRVYVRGYYYSQTATPPAWVAIRHSNVYWYQLDDDGDTKSSYQNVRFHWLNTVGGIDSYTARRDVLESINISKSLMQTQLPGRRYFQDDVDSAGAAIAGSAYYSDTMRGFDTYKGGKEVLSVGANTTNKVYTEPLNKVEATWLREMFTSPNVWVEDLADDSGQPDYDADLPSIMKDMNPYLRPGLSVYRPVILNNTEVISLNEAEGLVTYNIEYTYSQGILTQRN